VLLTTQYLDEADRLARQIAVVDEGRVVAQGTAAQLKANIGDNVLTVRVANPADVGCASAVLADLATGEGSRVDVVDGEIRVVVADSAASAEAVRRLDAQHVPITTVELQAPSLDDVFLRLTAQQEAA
jgi:ABC-2 type transport system ATP-binding protein